MSICDETVLGYLLCNPFLVHRAFATSLVGMVDALANRWGQDLTRSQLSISYRVGMNRDMS